MPRKSKYYVLTPTAERDFRQARKWSIERWGKELTLQYFTDLHDGAENIAKNQKAFQARQHLGERVELDIATVREHYIIYVPITNTRIAIVALIRQTRDVPKILEANAFAIKRELEEISKQLVSNK